ncbi:MAG: LPS assembly protein LptD, partial [Gammaproteobacteria bacterium]
MFNKWFRRLILACLAVASPLATAQGSGAISSDWMLCGEPGSPVHQHEPLPFNAKADEATYLNADESRATHNEIFEFSGDVEVRRGNQRLNADTATYNQPRDTVEAHGNIRFEQDGLTVEGDSARLELGAGHGQIETARYGLVQRHAHGESSLLVMEDPNHTRLTQATFTTCNPGHDDWLLHASDLKLDHEKNIGEARNVWLEFKGVPFLYLPYINFPLSDQRKSGFLTPSFGTSDQVGTDIHVPYYWNIAPQRDATITTRMMSKRGVQLLGEFRYISAASGGLTNAGYVPYDNVANKSRSFLSTHNVWNFAPRWSSELEFGYVSDKDYFGELGTSLSVASTTHLERRADATYHGDFWSFTGRAQSYQTVDESLPGSARPYQRLPQLLVNLNLPQQAYGSNTLFNGEYVHFYRRDSVVGDRIDLQPGVSPPLKNSYGYLTPALNLRYTQYALDQQTEGSGGSSPSRILPVVSLDSGVYLERNMSWGSAALLQTLEPRLYYLYVPYRDQSSLPVFDTNLLDFSYASLFQNNRFSGPDRVGDANQIAIALTSRLLDSSTGRERL